MPLKILVAGADRPTQRELQTLYGQLGRLWYFKGTPSWGGVPHILLGDGYGLDAQAAHHCARLPLPYTVFGLTFHPRNSTSEAHYQRIVTTCQSKAEREIQRDLHMLNQADDVLIIGTARVALIEQAEALGKRIIYRVQVEQPSV